jgi:WD40 repeat protein
MIVLVGRKQDVDALAFSPEGKRLAVGGTASHVQLWDLETRTVQPILGPKGPHRAVAFLPGEQMMTATADAVLRLGERTSKRAQHEYESARNAQVSFIHAAPTTSFNAVVMCGQFNWGPLLECVALPGLTLRWRKTGRSDVGEQPFRLQPCPDGKMVVATDHNTYHIDPATGDKVRDLGWHLNHVPAIAVSPDGSLLAVAAGMDLQTIALASGERGASARGSGRKHFTDVAFHPSGRILAVSSNNETVRLLDARTLVEVMSFDWEVGPVRRIVFSPDGMRAAAAGKTGRVVVWDVYP